MHCVSTNSAGKPFCIATQMSSKGRLRCDLTEFIWKTIREHLGCQVTGAHFIDSQT